MTEVVKGHKPDCTCTVCDRHRGSEAVRQAKERYDLMTRDSARLTIHSMGGPDEVVAAARAMGDEGAAIRMLEAAQYDVQGIMGRYRSDSPITPQVSSNPSIFSGDPRHSPIAMSALAGTLYRITDERGQRHGDFLSSEEAEERRDGLEQERPDGRFQVIRPPGGIGPFNAKVAELEQAREQQQREQAAARRILFTDQHGQPVFEDKNPAPVQRSTVHRQWESFPDHQGAPA